MLKKQTADDRYPDIRALRVDMKKTTHDDGMTRVVKTTYASVGQRGAFRGKLRATKRDFRALSKRLTDAPPFTFDGRIEDIERSLRVWLAAQDFTPWLETGVDTVDPPVLSKQWYAREIVTQIEFVRALLRNYTADLATAAAVELGMTIQAAVATFAWGLARLFAPRGSCSGSR